MTLGKNARLLHESRFRSLQLLPHDTHEILNISGIELSGLTADFFEKKAAMKNVAEVLQFHKYDEKFDIIDEGPFTYNVRFKTVKDCKDYFDKIKNGDIEPEIDGKKFKISIYKSFEQIKLGKIINKKQKAKTKLKKKF